MYKKVLPSSEVKNKLIIYASDEVCPPINWIQYECELLRKLGRRRDYCESRSNTEDFGVNQAVDKKNSRQKDGLDTSRSPPRTAADSYKSKYIQVACGEEQTYRNTSALDSLHRMVFGDALSTGRCVDNTARFLQNG